MILEKLTLLNYRSIREATLDFSPNVNCFVGANGMGKTNVLDAIYYLSFVKSSVCSLDAMNIHHDENFFMLDAYYHNTVTESQEHVVCALKRGQRKHLKRNDKEYRKFSEHIGLIPLVLISPADSNLVTGGSEERRKFMDTVISQCDSEYLAHYMNYQKALQQRNLLLKSEDEPDWEYVGVLEQMMATAASYIYNVRANFIQDFVPIFQEMYRRLCPSDNEVPELTYQSHGERGDLLPLLQAGRDKERIVGYTLHGVHKDDILLKLNGFDLRREGSQGQTKTYVIAMKLSQYVFLRERHHSDSPILLLDDIFDKLDASRVNRIIEYVSSDALGQIFITDTNREHMDRILESTHRDYQLFRLPFAQSEKKS